MKWGRTITANPNSLKKTDSADTGLQASGLAC